MLLGKYVIIKRDKDKTKNDIFSCLVFKRENGKKVFDFNMKFNSFEKAFNFAYKNAIEKNY